MFAIIEKNGIHSKASGVAEEMETGNELTEYCWEQLKKA